MTRTTVAWNGDNSATVEFIEDGESNNEAPHRATVEVSALDIAATTIFANDRGIILDMDDLALVAAEGVIISGVKMRRGSPYDSYEKL